MSKIALIGSINQQHYYQESDISTLLGAKQQALQLGNAFVGRPGTRIYSNDDSVVKIRAELDLSLEKAYLWTRNELEQERKMQVHHPHKTWFVFDDSVTGQVLVGSICPHLQPLHVLFKTAPQTAQERMRYLNILAAVFKMYLQLGKEQGYKLDEGLSNFAIDTKGGVYYLDDEYYSWDSFISFTVMLGVFIRSFDWLDEDFIASLSNALGESVDWVFRDPHCRVIISSQLRSVFMPAGKKHQLLDVMVQAITQNRTLTNKTVISNPPKISKQQNTRYFAVMADIHANEAALDCVLDFYQARNIEQGLVLGDIVGYGPDPSICIQKLQDSPFDIIKGNHDHAVAIANTDRGFSKNAKDAIDWTVGQLSHAEREWLQYLPSYQNHPYWYAVHGAPMDPAFLYGYVYLMTAEDNLKYMQEKQMPLCLHGHSHMPGIYAWNKQRVVQKTTSKVELTQFQHVLACPGSVGQPRNGYPDAQCAIYDSEQHTLEWFTIPYVVDAVVQRMQQYGLPEQLWQRLPIGK
jgi:predicted phosphodiesterase